MSYDDHTLVQTAYVRCGRHGGLGGAGLFQFLTYLRRAGCGQLCGGGGSGKERTTLSRTTTSLYFTCFVRVLCVL